MFDCGWVDPNRETVGQRRNRKERNGTAQSSRGNSGLSRRSSMLSSRSSETTASPSKPSLLNLFGGNIPAQTTQTITLNRTRSQKLSALENEKSTNASQWVAKHQSVALDPPEQEVIEVISNFRIKPKPSIIKEKLPISTITAAVDHSDIEHSPSEESVFSGWTSRSAKTQSSWSSESTSGNKIVQPLSATSFVTQSTKVTVSPRGSVKSEEAVATVVRISASNKVPLQVREVHNKKSPTIATTIYDFPLPNIGRMEEKSTAMVKREVERQTGWPFTTRGKQGDAWKPPETWECPSDEESKPVPVILRPHPIDKRRGSTPIEVTHLQRNIRKMEAASPKIVLERLKEEWTEIADASVYRELELEKQLWMLTALRSLRKRGASTIEFAPQKSVASGTKILSLYENHAVASSLSALALSRTEVHHLSTSPLSPKSYPNIHPLSVPGPTSQLPYASNIFASIHTFALPSLLPASSIPSILKECHRTLTSAPHPPSPTSPTTPLPFSTHSTATSSPNLTSRGGTLHLTILDPSPLPSTLGPRLRAWLDGNLMLNLEKQFRCINPARLFPIWLADAGLRAEGSTIVHVRFNAVVPSALASHFSSSNSSRAPSRGSTRSGERDGGDGPRESMSAGVERTKMELKSMVGRMLWREMWGSYVQGDCWWWEDDGVVEECERLGTVWEYAVIEAIKEG